MRAARASARAASLARSRARVSLVARRRCNTHALCSVCVHSNGTVDKYCQAFMTYYDFTDKWVADTWDRSHEYNVQLFWLNVHFWCNTTVLEAIRDDTFEAKLQAGTISNYMHIDVASDNLEEFEYWGTTKVSSASS